MNQTVRKSFTFTGWHMLGVTFLFFGTIIAVNIVMAWSAVSTWSGLVVKNTYVASQEFNGKAAEARALSLTGIQGKLVVDGPSISYTLTHPERASVEADEVTLIFKRPVEEHNDFRMNLASAGPGRFVGRHGMAAGQWIVDITSKEKGRIVYHEAIRVKVGGATS
ncbi:FixH family protein [Rhizobium sp. CFBP 8762]|uniref:FixH family protein n=1 Tax=Rhizobium sp. CFBP 8762 TaxID=2775279 RepID=UPI00177D1492|nr:FixH family protein [Rhizobium sp. CFBP 8762]MBD8554717.1 FixH family protein [Rhizobium sp. CFBP 8762]